MDEGRGKSATVIVSSSEEEQDYDDGPEEESSDHDEESESDYIDIDDDEVEEEEKEYSDRDEAFEFDEKSLSDKVSALLEGGKDIDSLKLNECKAYLRKHGLRLAGNRAVCVARIKEHWRLKHGSGYNLYPRSSFNINCTGDVCIGDVVLFRQKVYEKFNKVTRHGRMKGNRTVAGRVVKESYGAAKQQHTFTVEVLWSSGVRKLPPLYPLLVKGRNLYKLKTYRQRWKDEAVRVEVLSEKHRRGAAARCVRALKQKDKSYNANGSKGSKRQHEIQSRKQSKGRSREPNKVRHLDGSRRANDYRHQETTSSKQATWKDSEISRASRYAGEIHKSAEFEHYQDPVYPLHVSNRQIPYQSQVNSQSRYDPNRIFYHERGRIPNMTGFPSSRPSVGESTSRGHVSGDRYYAHTNQYDFEMRNSNLEHIDRPLNLPPRDKYGWRK